MTREEAIFKANHLRKVHPSICIDAEDFWETVIAALEQEPKMGQWIELPTHESQSGLPWYECSECNSERCIAVLRDFKYCPSCGAKMAESEEV